MLIPSVAGNRVVGSVRSAAGTPVWQDGTPAARCRSASGTLRFRTLIIGAGLTGLSTALHLAENEGGRGIAILDAGVIAAGASGRGTGLVGPRIGPPLRVAYRRFGEPTARALFEWSQRAARYVPQMCDRFRLRCDLVPGTQLIVARDAAAARRLEREAAVAHRLGVDLTPMPGDELATPPGRYRGGLLYRDAATVNPAALARGMAAAAERRGVDIFENSAVERVIAGDTVRVLTGDAELLADRVVIAVNGLAGSTLPAAGVVGMRVQAAATEPLSQTQLAEVGWLHQRVLIESGAIAPYFRLTTDRRLIVGGGAVVRGTDGSAALDESYLRAAAGALFTEPESIRITHAWSGPIGMTRDALPILGARRTNVLVAGGWCGHGIAAATYAGSLLAAQLHAAGTTDSDGIFPVARGAAPAAPAGRLIGRLLDRYLARLGAEENRVLGTRLQHDFRRSRIGGTAGPTGLSGSAPDTDFPDRLEFP